MKGFTLELIVNKEVLKVVTCSLPLKLTLNLGTDILFEKLKVTAATKGGGCNFQIKNKLKSEIFNDKKSF